VLSASCGPGTTIYFGYVGDASADAGGQGGCAAGDLGCACYPNDTCNGTNVCVAKTCVAPVAADGGTGGAGGSGGSGTGGGGVGGAAGSGTGGSETGGAAGGGTGGSGGAPNRNMVVNGDFAAGETLWKFEPYPTTLTYAHAISSDALCVTVTGTGSLVIGYPVDTAYVMTLQAGARYTLSYRAILSTTYPASIEAKLGHSVEPYTAYIDSTDSIGTSWTTYSHTMTTPMVAADLSVGVALIVQTSYASPTTVCIDDVSVMPAS
jgi:hypothetical protein